MSIVKRAATWIAATAAAVAMVTVVTAGPSFAAESTTALATSSAGYGYFNGDVQILSIHDSHPDGYGVAIIYYRYDLANPGPYYAWNREGYNTTTYLYLHMRPNSEIRLYSCPEKGGLILEYECGARATAFIPI